MNAVSLAQLSANASQKFLEGDQNRQVQNEGLVNIEVEDKSHETVAAPNDQQTAEKPAE